MPKAKLYTPRVSVSITLPLEAGEMLHALSMETGIFKSKLVAEAIRAMRNDPAFLETVIKGAKQKGALNG